LVDLHKVGLKAHITARGEDQRGGARLAPPEYLPDEANRAHDRRPNHGGLHPEQDGINRDGDDRQERRQQLGRETQENGAEQGT
jgi:hypothetical protein